MDEFALEGIDTLDIRPLPVAMGDVNISTGSKEKGKRSRGGDQLQHTASVDEDVDFIFEDSTVNLLDLDLPFGLVFVPDGRLDGVLVLDVLFAVILVGHAMHVLVNLLRGGIIVRPLWVGRKAVCVVVCRDVALAPGVSL